MLKRSFCLVVLLAIAFGVSTQVFAQNDPDKPVPPEEVSKLLEEYTKYIRTKQNPSTSTTLPEILKSAGPNLPPPRKESLVKEAQQAGIDDQTIELLLTLLPKRVEQARQDFYAANLEPLQFSATNFRLKLPTLRRDFDRLKSAKVEMEKYEAELQKLQDKEWDLLSEEFRILIKQEVDTREPRENLRKQYENAILRSDDPHEKEVLRMAFLSELAKMETPMESRSAEWEKLDEQDMALAKQYVRKVFMFEIPPPYRGGNKTELLVDGKKAYGRISELASDVAKNGKGNGYVHIALWWCEVGTNLNDRETFYQAIKGVVDSGNEVAVILWKGSGYEVEHVKSDNADCQNQLTKIGAHVITLLTKRVIASYHQKYFIFCNGSEVHVIVGGLNMDKKSLASAPHSSADANAAWIDVHDVAVELSGPATRDVEDDFASRWRPDSGLQHLRGPTIPVPSGNDEVKIAETPQGRVQIGEPVILDPTRNSIRDELVRRIYRAEKYIYLENYAVHDETLVRAIGQRIKEKKLLRQPFDVIILIPKHFRKTVQVKTLSGGFKQQNGPTIYGWLHWITYQHLSFMGCDSFTFINEDGRAETIKRKTFGTKEWRVGPYEGTYYQDTKVYWDSGSTKLTRIIEFNPDTPLYTLVYHNESMHQDFPVWIHSKVALFDDEYAAIGSANFNTRSMIFDGELDAFTHGPRVTEFRKEIWSEYWEKAPEPGNWRVAAENNQKEPRADDGEAVLPLHRDDFEKDWDELAKIIKGLAIATMY